MSCILRFAIAVVASSVALDAGATQWCVSTGYELDAAMDVAASNGVDDEIRITNGVIQGSFKPPQRARWEYLASANDQTSALTISGGWTKSAAGTCDQQTGRATDTKLDAKTSGLSDATVLDIGSNFAGYSGDVTVSNLTIMHGAPMEVSWTHAAALEWTTVSAGPASSFTVERVVISLNESPNHPSSIANIVFVAQKGGGVVKFMNNTIVDNAISDTDGGSIVYFYCEAPAICYVNNNSIFHNFAVNNQHDYALRLEGVVNASNNAVGDNEVGSAAYTGVQVGGGLAPFSLTLKNNHFESRNFTHVYSEIGTSFGDPKWTRIGDFAYPNWGSPLLNTGVNNASGGVGTKDVDGNVRILDDIVERGAIETSPNAPPAIRPETVGAIVVDEGTSSGKVVHGVAVVDDGKSGPLKFSLNYVGSYPSSFPQIFAIDSNGLIRTTAAIPTGVGTYIMKVTVSDGEFNDSESLLVKINRAPAVTPAVATALVAPDAEPGTLVFQFAGADDGLPTNVQPTFKIISVESAPVVGKPNPFVIDAASGQVKVQQPIDATTTEYTVVVNACDISLCSSAKLVATVGTKGADEIFGNGFDSSP